MDLLTVAKFRSARGERRKVVVILKDLRFVMFVIVKVEVEK